MGLLSSIAKIAVPLVLTAATGGAAAPALISMAAKSIASQVAMQVIQKLGQEMGLPPSAIGLATAAFAQTSGQPDLAKQSISDAVNGVAEQFRFSPVDSGHLQRQADNAVGKLLQSLMQSEEVKAEKTNSKSGGSFLVKLAKAMGALMDKQMNRMVELTDQISRQTSIAQGKGKAADRAKTELGSLNGELAAVGQELNIISQAMNTAIKSIGDAQSTVARKN